MFNICRRQSLLVLAAGCASPFVRAERPPQNLIASVIDIAPWGRRGADGKAGGVYAEVFKRLGELSGINFELQLTPIKRAVLEVSSGFSQATMMLERADLNKGAVVIGTVTTLEIEVWLPVGSPLRSLSQLAGKKIATLRGPAYHEEFDANNRIVKVPVTGARQQLEMLRSGRVDGALGVRQNFLVAMRELGQQGDAFGDPIWLGSRRVMLWIAPSLRGSEVQVQLGRALSQLRSSGEIDRMLAQQVYAER